MIYLLDTDTCSYFLRDSHGVRVRLQSVGARNLVVSRITYSELMVLAVRRKHGKITRQSVESFLDTIPFVEVDDASWALFPEIKAGLIQRGRSLGKSGNFDILQACVAITNGYTVVTHNEKHYRAIADLVSFELEDWASI